MAEAYEARPGVALGQRTACVNRSLRVERSELLCSLKAVALQNDLARVLHVTRLAELALDQCLQLGVLVGGIQHRGGRQTKRHVLQTRLAQIFTGAREVEEIVDDLECQAKMVAKLLGRDGHVALEGVTAEKSGTFAAVGHERSRL